MEPIKFENILNEIKNEKNLWLVAERKWTYRKNLDILDIENKKKKLNPDNDKTGLFITKNIRWKDISEFIKEYADCVRMIFFNKDVQYQFIKDSGDKYWWYKSEIKDSEDKEKKLKNVYPTTENRSHFRFNFAKKLGTIHDLTKGDPIQVIQNKTGEWRLYHE